MGRQLLLNGVGLMSFWLHDEMVSLDLLESLPGVDRDNLGVVGCSGGGTQSSYLGAMDLPCNIRREGGQSLVIGGSSLVVLEGKACNPL